jgi:flagellar hook-associated protein 2
MAVESIAKTLGTGSGIDVTALVTSLVDAQFANKTETLTRKSEALEAQISSVSSLKSAIASFDTALKSLIGGGTLATQPTSGNTNLVKVSMLPGAAITSLAAAIEVRQLATAQTSSTDPLASKTAAMGTGKLTLRLGTATVADGEMSAFTPSGTPVEINITSANNSLEGIAAAINAKNAGVAASVLSDSAGHRLVLKGATGEAAAFTLTATEDVGQEGLAALNVGVGATGTTIGASARNAIVAIDGVAVTRTGNSISDLIPGVRVDLVGEAVGTKVAIGSQGPGGALTQAVGDFVSTYNEVLAMVKEATDPVTGPLRTDPAAKALMRSLQGLTVKDMVPNAAPNTPRTLAALGIATARDGTLSLNGVRLAASVVSYPANIEAMFKAGSGLSAALTSISNATASTVSGLGASATRYTKVKATITADQQKALDSAEALRTRMTRQFATMDSIVARYKSTQTFLENQIDAWNNQD